MKEYDQIGWDQMHELVRAAVAAERAALVSHLEQVVEGWSEWDDDFAKGVCHGLWDALYLIKTRT